MGIYTENLEAANSRIRDTDMAEETANLTKSNILTQANVSVLGQANQNPAARFEAPGLILSAVPSSLKTLGF